MNAKALKWGTRTMYQVKALVIGALVFLIGYGIWQVAKDRLIRYEAYLGLEDREREQYVP